MIQVKAKLNGYYGNVYRFKGDNFTIESEDDFSKRWMIRISGGKRGRKPKAKPEPENQVAEDEENEPESSGEDDPV